MTSKEIKLGRRIRTRVAWSGVPQYTQGVIDETHSLHEGDGGVSVAWDLPRNPLPKGYKKYDGRTLIQTGILRDGFAKDELHYLEIV